MVRVSRPKKLRPKLAPDEEIVAAAEATATGTGRAIGIGAAIGALIGLLYATTGDSTSWWSATALGGFVGIIVGYGQAWLAVRRPGGPGAVSVIAVMTNQRLIVLRRSASVRSRPLRSFNLHDIVRILAKPAPFGPYEWVRFIAEPHGVDLFMNSNVDFVALHREHKASQQVD